MRRVDFDQVFLARYGQTEVAALPGIGGVFSSPLGRAVTTATACARRLGLPVTAIQDLAEVHHGAMAGLTGSEIEPGSPVR